MYVPLPLCEYTKQVMLALLKSLSGDCWGGRGGEGRGGEGRGGEGRGGEGRGGEGRGGEGRGGEGGGGEGRTEVVGF